MYHDQVHLHQGYIKAKSKLSRGQLKRHLPRITSDLLVASLRILEVSVNSTINVDCPAMMLSLAPILVKILSKGVSLHLVAGT